MRHIACLSCGMVLAFSLATTSHAALITDDFDADNDYTTNLGVWSGTTSPAVASAGGQLTVSSPAGGSGFLFMDVSGSQDFVATVEFTSGPSVPPEWQYPETLFGVYDAAATAYATLSGTSPGAGSRVDWRVGPPDESGMLWGMGNVGWKRIERTAGEFSFWYGDASGTSWTQFGSATAPLELAGAVRVALGASTPYGMTTASFDNFSLLDQSAVAPVPEPSTFLLLSAGLIGLLGFVRRRRE